ncbi:MAG: hypothetical protein DRG78_20090 [Epsilonproteobacteria bacterium]|nr:MAG: hypothetical protein DRG78_20090 [Campylobacterota bacterium]
MITFQNIEDNHNTKKTINTLFGVELQLNGGWGYAIVDATTIEDIQEGIPIYQLEHMIVSMRSHLEMNITQEKDNRYAGINANELSRENIKKNEFTYDKVTYEITAMKEDIYNKFIQEYKEGYGKENFDITEHFKKRKEATLIREVVHYFEISKII